MDFLHTYALVLHINSEKSSHKSEDTSDTNLVISKHIKSAKSSFPVNVRR